MIRQFVDEQNDRQIGFLRFSRRDLLALEAVVDIAYNARARSVGARELADRLEIPPRYLEHTLQRLARGGVLKSLRGPRGGYVLARERRRISIGSVLRVLNKDAGASAKSSRNSPDEPSSRLGNVALFPVWLEIGQSVLNRLDSITVEDLCKELREAGFKPEAEGIQDFTI